MKTVTHTENSAWRLFPWYVVMALGVVVAANAVMAYFALHTFPGVAEQNVFDHSNAYDKVLTEARAEAELGWSVQLLQQDGMTVLVLADRTGAPLVGGDVQVVAQRPLGPDMRTVLQLHETAAGRYEAAERFSLPGQWDLLVSGRVENHPLHLTKRIIVP